MSGSVAATFVLLFAGVAAAAVLWAVRHVNRHSHQVAGVEQLRAQVVEQAQRHAEEMAEANAHNARLEGENARLRAENVTLKDLATGRKDLQDILQELRVMFWAAFGPNEEASRGRRPRTLRQPEGE